MRCLVTALHTESQVTTVFVTHDQAGAVEVADTIALMLDGRLEGQGDPEMLYTAPPSLVAARFFGVTNELPGTVRTGAFTAAATGLRRPATLLDGPAVLVIRPETITLTSPPAMTTRGPGWRSPPGSPAPLAVDVQLTGGPPVTCTPR
jgi:ABC-type sulfate/molybdate transport systems ATPase subunit